MDIALWINNNSTVIITIVAVVMLIIAFAKLKISKGMKEIEESKLRISNWPDLKNLILAIDKYAVNVNKGDLSTSFQEVFDYINVVQFAPYLFGEEERLILHLKELKDIGSDIYLLHAELPIETGSNDGKNRASEINEKRRLLNNKVDEIKNILKSWGN